MSLKIEAQADEDYGPANIMENDPLASFLGQNR